MLTRFTIVLWVILVLSIGANITLVIPAARVSYESSNEKATSFLELYIGHGDVMFRAYSQPVPENQESPQTLRRLTYEYPSAPETGIPLPWGEWTVQGLPWTRRYSYYLRVGAIYIVLGTLGLIFLTRSKRWKRIHSFEVAKNDEEDNASGTGR